MAAMDRVAVTVMDKVNVVAVLDGLVAAALGVAMIAGLDMSAMAPPAHSSQWPSCCW